MLVFIRTFFIHLQVIHERLNAVKKKIDLLMYPSVKLLMPLALGIAVGDMLEEYITPVVWWVMMVCMIIITYFTWKMKYIQSLLLLSTVFLIGGTLVSMKRQSSEIRLPDTPITFKAVLLSNPIVRGKVVQVDLMAMTKDRPIW